MFGWGDKIRRIHKIEQRRENICTKLSLCDSQSKEPYFCHIFGVFHHCLTRIWFLNMRTIKKNILGFLPNSFSNEWRRDVAVRSILDFILKCNSILSFMLDPRGDSKKVNFLMHEFAGENSSTPFIALLCRAVLHAAFSSLKKVRKLSGA